ncbi:MAG: class I SAM-dependent methyltransferase [Proteobacteria bacterium]|uniref:class I SAM-dependent methyltransferase n=1 Tax=Rudaea sp. TaxID=2136325 RepID=UPI001D318DDA|nr:class I SAM-dependent methyltransferase [Pseudomonadota bacterium]MBS0566731.1 class I SAM-dependent methyltransferase [Pseudomonadota bacterium]
MTTSTSAAALEFTGERFTPECVREIWYEHWARYAFAAGFAHGKRVLDAACGEGFGSALLARTAAQVTGLDVSAQAVAHAQARYGGAANLRYVQGDCTQLDLPAASVDLVVSIETLEHVLAQEDMVAGFARVLGEDGVFIVSSPDKHAYSDVTGFRNEYHVRELYRDELLALLGRHFPEVRLYGQKLLFQSAIWALDEAGTKVAGIAATTAEAAADGSTLLKSGLQYDPLYFIAVCSRRPLGDLPSLALFGDRAESVYAHYNHEVRKNIAAGGRIAELEAQTEALRAEVERLRGAGKP